jgi:hypothetical protein
MSIPETPSKIKSWAVLGLKIGSFVLILGLVFILGRISVLATLKQADPIEVIYPPLVKTSIPQYNQAGNTAEPESWAFAGSKTGKTYYPKGCSGLSRIKPENRVYFTTATEATSAGYHPSTACN